MPFIGQRKKKKKRVPEDGGIDEERQDSAENQIISMAMFERKKNQT